MKSRIGLIKSFFTLFGIVLISKKELEEKREILYEKLKAAEEESCNHYIEVKKANQDTLDSKRKKAIDHYVIGRPMLVKGEISLINDILNEYGLASRDGFIPGI